MARVRVRVQHPCAVQLMEEEGSATFTTTSPLMQPHRENLDSHIRSCMAICGCMYSMYVCIYAHLLELIIETDKDTDSLERVNWIIVCTRPRRKEGINYNSNSKSACVPRLKYLGSPLLETHARTQWI